jgi:putative addiction module killer protein
LLPTPVAMILDSVFPAGYTRHMKYALETTAEYDRWFSSIKDRTTRIRVLARLSRVENGNFGDCRQISEGLHELRFFWGGGVRIYYTIRNKIVVFLLTGGDKSSQRKNIAQAIRLLNELGD